MGKHSLEGKRICADVHRREQVLPEAKPCLKITVNEAGQGPNQYDNQPNAIS